MAEICRQLSKLDGFEAQFVAMVEEAGAGLENRFEDESRTLRHDEDAVKKEKANLLAVLKKVGERDFLVEEIEALDNRQGAILVRRHQLEQRRTNQLVLPESMSAIQQMLEEEFRQLAIDSPSFGKLMRSLVPEFYVYAVRLCDGGRIFPRAKVKLNLAGTFPDINLIPGLGQILTQELTLDLFDPTQRERIREEAVQLAARGMKPRAIAQEIAEKPTATAVQNALALHRTMLSFGLNSPYVTLQAPPEDYPKLRRHKHARYRFQPLDGYVPPTL